MLPNTLDSDIYYRTTKNSLTTLNCLNSVKTVLINKYCQIPGFAVGAMFVREVFHIAAKTEGEVMIDNIRAAFKKNLKHLDWMDSETRDAAQSKADAITDMIGEHILL